MRSLAWASLSAVMGAVFASALGTPADAAILAQGTIPALFDPILDHMTRYFDFTFPAAADLSLTVDGGASIAAVNLDLNWSYEFVRYSQGAPATFIPGLGVVPGFNINDNIVPEGCSGSGTGVSQDLFFTSCELSAQQFTLIYAPRANFNTCAEPFLGNQLCEIHTRSTFGSIRVEFALGSTAGSFTLQGELTDLVAPPTSVPEPAMWAMMIAGFGAVGAMARRQRTALPV